MSAVLIIALASLAAGDEARLKPIEGESQAVRVVGLSSSQAVVEAGGQQRTIPAKEVLWFEFPTVAAEAEPTAWLELLDGSTIRATEFTTKAGQARIVTTAGQTVEMPARSVRAVRFAEPTPELADAWRAVLESRPAGDLVVIRPQPRIQNGADGEPAAGEAVLDQLEGTILDVALETVQFSVGGEEVPARREKIVGLVYYQPTRRTFSAPVCRLTDVGGSAWLLRDVKLTDERISASTLGGIQCDLPLAAVTKVDFSVGNIQFLADLEPDARGAEPTVALQPANMTFKFSHIFRMRHGPPLGADAFRIQGAKYDTGLSLHSPVTLVYRVPEGFRRFRAVAGIDDSLVAPGTFELVILGDGKELLRQSFSSESRQALPIDLDLAGVRRVSIVLDPADGQDIGDQLNLCEARFTK